MTPITTDKGPFYPLEPYTLMKLAGMIETACPGWWWSISQKSNEIFVSLGPGRNGPHPQDLTFALTKEGDQGRHLSVVREADVLAKVDGTFRDISVRVMLNQFLASFNIDRGFDADKFPPAFSVAPDWKHRYQTSENLEALASRMKSFIMNDLPPILEKGYVLEQIYTGSCDLSADCSLRGKRPDGSEFDISVDLQRDATLADSLDEAIEDLANDRDT